MKPWPPFNITGDTLGWLMDYVRKIAQQRGDDVRELSALPSKYVTGRYRRERPAPTSNADVQKSDVLGDIVRTASYEYIVVNDSGTLKWARQALDVGW